VCPLPGLQAKPPVCALKTPTSAGAVVTVTLPSARQALFYFNSFAIGSRANIVAVVLALPCRVSSITFSAPDVAQVAVFDGSNLTALRC
jgi:hypothetical protein